jgi:hypothetical protein
MPKRLMSTQTFGFLSRFTIHDNLVMERNAVRLFGGRESLGGGSGNEVAKSTVRTEQHIVVRLSSERAVFFECLEIYDFSFGAFFGMLLA